ncbi:MAG: Hpt domain-containing protein [Desulfobacteraceae bacterium]|jgi:HPt (histidine-containing phosphotransfer) domain-containing protein
MNFKELADNLGLEVDEYRELIELFVETGTADLNNIQEALANNDSEQVMRSAHTIKGAAGNLGLEEVSETAKIIEENANSNQSDGLESAVQTLKNQIKAIEAFVNA